VGSSRTLPLPLVISFGVIVLDELVQRSSQRSFTEQDEFDKDSCFTERTHLSAKALD